MTTQERVQEHYNEALQYFDEQNIMGIFLQGSQNYGLSYEHSDVDTKLIVLPSFEDIAMNKKPVSTTHVRANDEHVDFKDMRLYIQLFKKQNINFVEILFTDYYILNPLYAEQWNRLVEAREEIARYDLKAAIKTMKGQAMEKFHAMEHRYPSKVELIDKYGYDGKQLSHLYRIQEFLHRYIDGESYAECLRPRDPSLLVSMKKNEIPLDEARVMAEAAIHDITTLVDKQCMLWCFKDPNEDVAKLLDDVQLNIMKEAIRRELI